MACVLAVNLPKHWTEDYRDYQTIPRTYEISQKNNERASRIVHWYTLRERYDDLILKSSYRSHKTL